jgi:hypothetical protein
MNAACLKKLRRFAFATALLLITYELAQLLSSAPVHAEPSPLPLASYDWAVKASPNLATHPPPVEAVRNFMEQTSFDGVSGDGAPVCSFRFVDLRHAQNLTLLVTLDDGGRGGCGGLYIVDRTATGFQLHSGLSALFIFGIDDVNQVVRDIAHDGQLELIFDSEFTDYEGAVHCLAFWPVIYGWDGKNYSYLSAEPRFRPFYENEIKTLGAGTPDDCDQATIAKIQRFFGAPRNTGMTDAIRWAKSSDPLQREFAVGVLSDIGTPEAKKYLRMLTKDKNVGLDAKMEFAYRHFGKPAPEAEFLDNAGSTNQDRSANDADDKDQLTQLAEPWRFIVPPTIGDKLDLKASDRKWNVLHGFDSMEQCGLGIELIQRDYSAGGGPNYQATLHGKCVPAPTPKTARPT